MEYILVEHSGCEADEAERVYSELDEGRQERRRVEFTPDGLCFAYGGEHGHEEVLQREPFPENFRDFEPDEDTKAYHIRPAVFFEVWNHAAESPDNFMELFF